MHCWAVVIPEERYSEERLVGADVIRVPSGDREPGDRVALVAATDPPVVFGFGVVTREGWVRYTRRLFDEPLPGDGLDAGPLTEEAFQALAAKAGPAAPVRTWLVGVDLPIEADTRAEAVRKYWSYLRDLGPAELPAYVAPIGDELSMQAYLLGMEAPLDPEED